MRRTKALKLRPASTRTRVLSVASSAQLPELPLASTQNLTMSGLRETSAYQHAAAVDTLDWMKVARIHQHGGPEVLVYEDAPGMLSSRRQLRGGRYRSG